MIKSKKQKNEWGVKFERLLKEKQLSWREVITILRLHKMFSNICRTTIYRWMAYDEEKIPPNARVALNILQNAPKVNASAEVMLGWIERMKDLEERLHIMRKDVQDILAQLTFHQS